jgi:Protein of unknown function (DUF3455)
MKTRLIVTALAVLSQILSTSAAELPATIDVPNAVIVATYHAEGAQLYECSLDAGRKLWRFREPVASLISDGTTVGRHYAGPTWEHKDGSMARAKLAGSAPGATPDDIPWLRLDVVSQLGNGALYGVTSVQRINTRGGVATGACDEVGTFRSVPYAADYVFLRKD